MTIARSDRRAFLQTASIGAGLVILGRADAAPGDKDKDNDKNVSPTEDLMREHGVLRRVLFLYGEAIRRIDASQEVKPDIVARSAQIVRSFIEDYHERDEEEYLFPRFQKAKRLTELVEVLLAQHKAGRVLTGNIQKLATPTAMGKAETRLEMAELMRRFIRMYEVHAAREDTVLFPAFAALLRDKEMQRLEETFEEKEKALPTGDFEKMITDVTALEQALGIHDLAQFTAKT